MNFFAHNDDSFNKFSPIFLPAFMEGNSEKKSFVSAENGELF